MFLARFTVIMLAGFVIVNCLSAVEAAGDLWQQDSNSLMTPDPAGNTISVANRFDGSNYFVEVTNFARSGGINWQRQHYDGYQETANNVITDTGGDVYVAGVRLSQNHDIFWIMKYDADGGFLWERGDDNYPDCRAFKVVANDAGDSWVAGSCMYGNSFPMHIVHYDADGGKIFEQDYDGGGRNYVRDLNVDLANRASVVVEVAPGALGSGDSVTRTVVFDQNGGIVATY